MYGQIRNEVTIFSPLCPTHINQWITKGSSNRTEDLHIVLLNNDYCAMYQLYICCVVKYFFFTSRKLENQILTFLSVSFQVCVWSISLSAKACWGERKWYFGEVPLLEDHQAMFQLVCSFVKRPSHQISFCWPGNFEPETSGLVQ